MPWTARQFKNKHFKAASSEQARVAAQVANQVLDHTGDEVRAIREGISAAKGIGKGKK